MFREPIDEPDPEPSELRFTPSEMTDLIQHLYSLEKQYGIVVGVVTRGDIEDAWQQDHLADDKEAPSFTDEMWEKFQDTWAWRKGLSQAMWDGVWETIQDGLRDIADPSFGRVV